MNLDKLGKILNIALDYKCPAFNWDRDANNRKWSSKLNSIGIERTNEFKCSDDFILIEDPLASWRRSDFYYLKIPKEIAEKILVLGDLP